ncbi:DNA polymerase III subunit epsilon [Sphaerisporangium album]|uniref:DNA polymerase III subunit epsilon n=1 Tax=Sphaerisporangium album TaxID=509200 RepID=A0A367FAE3_9ACTN|nr:exonuclease domain-containing protein [Sphaerisporangium album]RCG27231.1 DNA polymerase III subunit epsilon [Sphaerisporangium album]
MAGPWYLARLAPFDLETTGKDPEEARIVEAYIGMVGGGLPQFDPPPILVDPGVEVPDEVAEIHGYTTEFLREHGGPAAECVDAIATRVADAVNEKVPLVGQNIRYDLTVLDRDCRRHGLPSLAERIDGTLDGLIIDTYVISKHVDRWRPRVSEKQGAHVLKTTAQVFGVKWNDDDAHGARYDALIAARVAWWMGRHAFAPVHQRPRLSGRRDERHLFDHLAVDLHELFAAQKRWAAEQAASYEEYLRSPKAGEKRDPDAVVSGDWPLIPAPTGALT